jgi:hypothetical protein
LVFGLLVFGLWSLVFWSLVFGLWSLVCRSLKLEVRG